MNVWTIILLTIIIGGIYIVAKAMGAEFPVVHASNCYDLLNAAGQVIQTVCH